MKRNTFKSIRDHEFYISNYRNLSFVWREPKQLRYWLKKAGLREEGKRSWNRNFPTSTWIGHGHRWRLNCYGLFEISCPNYDFDRWANSSTGINREIGLLETEEQFLSAVKEMLSKARAIVSEDSDAQ